MARVAFTALVAGTAVIGGAGCSGADPEDIERATSALGSTESVQYISTWAQLTQMTATGNYVLTANLNAAGKTWTPKDFRGTFDGGGKTISNLTINTSSGSEPNAGFFATLDGAIVRNVYFVALKVTARSHAGGIAGSAGDSLIERVSVQGNISTSGAAGISAGGIVGTGGNVTVTLSSMKGTVGSAVGSPLRYAGGIAGYLGPGGGRSDVTRSYAWATVSPETSDPGRIVFAGGIAGWTFGVRIQDVYAVGDVTGRGRVGGLVGSLTCTEDYRFVLNHGIYRGDVIDQNLTGTGSTGWAGTFGTFENCTERFDKLYWDSSRDLSTAWGTWSPVPQKSGTNQQLLQPTTPDGGIYSTQDNKFTADFWDAGQADKHHALVGLPGGLVVQPRCVTNGQPSAC